MNLPEKLEVWTDSDDHLWISEKSNCRTISIRDVAADLADLALAEELVRRYNAHAGLVEANQRVTDSHAKLYRAVKFALQKLDFICGKEERDETDLGLIEDALKGALKGPQ